MEVAAQERIVMSDRSQASAARLSARRLGRLAGLSEPDEHNAGIVATELATNLLKHAAAGGEILMRINALGPAPVVEILAIDRGPGIADVARALTDGHSTAGSAGSGLGAVRRLSSRFDIYSQRGQGTVVLAEVGRATAPAGMESSSATTGFMVGAVVVATAGEPVSGDAAALRTANRALRLLVVDGLGHGLGAHEASGAIVRAFLLEADASLPASLRRLSAAARPTRGAAAAIAEVKAGSSDVTFAGIGNIAGGIVANETRRLVSMNGILGHDQREAHQFQYPWNGQSALVLHTDGLASHWTFDQYPGLIMRHPTVIAGVLYRDHSRQRDDVTVVVAREDTR